MATPPPGSAAQTDSPQTGPIEWERKPKSVDANLEDYEAAYTAFDWKAVEREFDWSNTGKVNVVHEAVDRHAASARKNKVAL